MHSFKGNRENSESAVIRHTLGSVDSGYNVTESHTSDESNVTTKPSHLLVRRQDRPPLVHLSNSDESTRRPILPSLRGRPYFPDNQCHSGRNCIGIVCGIEHHCYTVYR